MSIKKIGLGSVGLGVAGCGTWFGISEGKKATDKSRKISRMQGTSKRINGYFSSSKTANAGFRLGGPRSGIWNKKFSYYSGSGKNDYNWNLIPESARKSEENLRDFCLQKAEENEQDVKKDEMAFDQTLPEDKKFWDVCLSGSHEMKGEEDLQ